MGGNRSTLPSTIAIVLCGAIYLDLSANVGAATARWTPIGDQGISVAPSPRPAPAVIKALAGVEASLGKQNVALRLVAPDGRKVAVYHRVTSSRFSLALVASDQTSPIKPVDADLDVGSIAWRPDSSALTLVTWMPGAPGSTVWQYEIDARRLSRLVHFDRELAYALAWNKQGHTLALLVSDEAHTGDRQHGNLFLIDRAGTMRQLTMDFSAVSPSWAPSGKQIAVGNEVPVGRPGSSSGINIFSVEGIKIRHEPSPRFSKADDDLQIDRVLWRTDRTILVRFSVFRGSDTPASDIQWHKLVLQ